MEVFFEPHVLHWRVHRASCDARCMCRMVKMQVHLAFKECTCTRAAKQTQRHAESAKYYRESPISISKIPLQLSSPVLGTVVLLSAVMRTRHSLQGGNSARRPPCHRTCDASDPALASRRIAQSTKKAELKKRIRVAT